VRGRDRVNDISSTAERHVLDHLLGRRIDHVPAAAALGIAPHSVDELFVHGPCSSM
jgi:hypothetical protein